MYEIMCYWLEGRLFWGPSNLTGKKDLVYHPKTKLKLSLTTGRVGLCYPALLLLVKVEKAGTNV